MDWEDDLDNNFNALTEMVESVFAVQYSNAAENKLNRELMASAAFEYCTAKTDSLFCQSIEVIVSRSSSSP